MRQGRCAPAARVFANSRETLSATMSSASMKARFHPEIAAFVRDSCGRRWLSAASTSRVSGVWLFSAAVLS